MICVGTSLQPGAANWHDASFLGSPPLHPFHPPPPPLPRIVDTHLYGGVTALSCLLGYSVDHALKCPPDLTKSKSSSQ